LFTPAANLPASVNNTGGYTFREAYTDRDDTSRKFATCVSKASGIATCVSKASRKLATYVSKPAVLSLVSAKPAVNLPLMSVKPAVLPLL
jgi:hypothetical protein